MFARFVFISVLLLVDYSSVVAEAPLFNGPDFMITRVSQSKVKMLDTTGEADAIVCADGQLRRFSLNDGLIPRFQSDLDIPCKTAAANRKGVPNRDAPHLRSTCCGQRVTCP